MVESEEWRVAAPQLRCNYELGGLHDLYSALKSMHMIFTGLHAVQEPDVATGAVAVPISLSTTFAQVSGASSTKTSPGRAAATRSHACSAPAGTALCASPLR